MIISKRIGQEIVREIENLVHQKINMMDENGVIIASSDSSRLGQVHSGALKIIKNNLPELYIEKNDISEGVQRGLNLPITINSKVVGVIGITGNYRDVVQIGQIVRKMAQILLNYQLERQHKEFKELSFYDFIEELIAMPTNDYTQDFIHRANYHNIDLSESYIIVIITPQNNDPIDNLNEESTFLNDFLKKLCNEKNFVFSKRKNQWIVLISHNNKNNTKSLLDCFFVQIFKQFKKEIPLYIGISSINNVSSVVHNNFELALKSLNVAQKNKKTIVFFDEIDVDLLLQDCSEKTKDYFMDKVFSNLSKKEIEEYVEILNTYFESHGSLKKCSEKLFIHENTLQYRLKKLASITNYDARKVSDLPIFYLALKIYKSKQK